MMDFPRAQTQGRAGNVHQLLHGHIALRLREPVREKRLAERIQRLGLLLAQAVRATSIATLPPPMTTTLLPMENRYPRLALSRKSVPVMTPSSSRPEASARGCGASQWQAEWP